ncbi:MAG: hypothetical protein ACK56I_19345, partial [bacterium]
MEASVFLPAKVVHVAKLVEGRLRIESVAHKGFRFTDAPCLAILARREMIVSSVIAADRHPSAVRHTVHRRFAKLLRLRFVVMADDFKGSEVIVQDCEGILLAREIIERYIG